MTTDTPRRTVAVGARGIPAGALETVRRVAIENGVGHTDAAAIRYAVVQYAKIVGANGNAVDPE